MQLITTQLISLYLIVMIFPFQRNLRCYNIAQLYYKVRDYNSAKYYLSMYLSVKNDSPQAYKLHGQIWEGLGDKVKALNAYKTSLEYDANQPGLVHKSKLVYKIM